MKVKIVFVIKSVLVVLAIVWLVCVGIEISNHVKAGDLPKLTIPDSRITDLEARVSNLEKWAQRQGMRY